MLQRFERPELPLTTPDRRAPAEEQPETGPRFSTRPFGALGHRFRFEVPDQEWAAYLAGALGSLASDGPAGRWSVIDHGLEATGGRYGAYRDGRRLFWCDDADDVVPLLLWWVNRTICFETDHRVMVHAAAVTAGDRALVLPAPQESGKTTLAAALVGEGFGYLTDEAAAFDPATGVVDPYPKWLSLKAGSWALFPHLRPRLPARVARFAASQWHVDPNAVRPDSVARSAEPAWLVVPRYEPGRSTDLQPMERSEALSLLAGEAFTLRRFGPAGFQVLAEVVRRSSCWRLTTGSLDDAVAAVRSITG